jgi:hypothetical protein
MSVPPIIAEQDSKSQTEQPIKVDIELKKQTEEQQYDDVINDNKTPDTWTPDNEKKLAEMKAISEKCYVKYKEQSNRYYTKDDIMSKTTIVLASLLVLVNSSSLFSDSMYQKVISVVISTVLTILYSFEKKYKFIKRVEQYSTKSSEYIKLARKIELVLSIQRDKRKTPTEVMISLDKKLTSLLGSELHIDADIDKKV